MSSTELERFKKRIRDAQARLSALTLPLWNAIGVRHLEGEVLDRNGLSVEGLEILTSLGQRTLTNAEGRFCLLYTSPSPRDRTRSRMPSSA